MVEANTLALFNELSVREDTRQDSKDRKGQVVEFLSGLNWINGLKNKEPLLSLSQANLAEANLYRANLIGANLAEANLYLLLTT